MRTVPLVTMVIPLNLVAAASHVAVVTTSTYQILSHVTGGLGSVSDVSTTLKDLSVQCARVATTGMHLVATAGVSKVDFSIVRWCWICHFVALSEIMV